MTRKTITSAALLFLSVLLLGLSGCGQTAGTLSNMRFDKDGNYLNFNNIEDLSAYSKRSALRDGCYVCKDNTYDGGGQSWDYVVSGTSAHCRFMRFYESGEEPMIMDVHYEDGAYHVFFSDRANPADTGYVFSTSKTLSGSLPGKKETRTFTVLTNDKDLIFDDLIPALTDESAEPENPAFCILLEDKNWLGILGG